jgi:hypothetical protein
MSLMTTRPWKHPKTGIYYLRRAVPADLLACIGKREEKISLGTKDPVRAKNLHARAFVPVDEPPRRPKAAERARGTRDGRPALRMVDRPVS